MKNASDASANHPYRPRPVSPLKPLPPLVAWAAVLGLGFLLVAWWAVALARVGNAREFAEVDDLCREFWNQADVVTRLLCAVLALGLVGWAALGHIVGHMFGRPCDRANFLGSGSHQ